MADIKLYEFDDEDKKLFFDVNDPLYVDGITELAQWFIKLLLDSEDGPLSPRTAGDLPGLIGKAQSFDEFRVGVTDIIKNIEEFMKEEQRGKVDDPNRRLASLDLRNIERGRTNDHIKVEVELNNEAQERLGVALPVEE